MNCNKGITLSITFLTLVTLGSGQLANAVVTNQQANDFLNLVEVGFPQYFGPPPLSTQSLLPDWPYYRGPYNSSGSPMYVGINADDSVYVLGGPFGDSPVRVGTFQNVLTLVQNTVNNANELPCNTADVPDFINYSQNGNVIDISTEGCPELTGNLPKLCTSNVSVTPQQTGISVLTTTDMISNEITGISSSDPNISGSIQQSLSSSVSTNSFCTIHALNSFASTTIINTDVCLTVTNLFSQFSAIPSVSITPPVTMSFQSTQTNTIVPDCFTTGAETITDKFTGDIWFLQSNGSYLTVPNI